MRPPPTVAAWPDHRPTQLMQEHQLSFYLDEFVFRFNRRNSRSRGHLFLRLLEQGLQTGPVTGDRIVGGHL